MQRNIKKEIIDALEGIRHGIKGIDILYANPLIVQFRTVGRIPAEAMKRILGVTQGCSLQIEYDVWSP